MHVEDFNHSLLHIHVEKLSVLDLLGSGRMGYIIRQIQEIKKKRERVNSWIASVPHSTNTIKSAKCLPIKIHIYHKCSNISSSQLETPTKRVNNKGFSYPWHPPLPGPWQRPCASHRRNHHQTHRQSQSRGFRR